MTLSVDIPVNGAIPDMSDFLSISSTPSSASLTGNGSSSGQSSASQSSSASGTSSTDQASSTSASNSSAPSPSAPSPSSSDSTATGSASASVTAPVPVTRQNVTDSTDATTASTVAAPATSFPDAANAITGKIDEAYIERLRSIAQEKSTDYQVMRNIASVEGLASQATLLISDTSARVDSQDNSSANSNAYDSASPVGGEAQATTAAYLDKAAA